MLKNLKGLAQAGPLGKLAYLMYGQISSKNEADAAYKDVIVVLKSELDRGAAFESETIQALVNILRKLPSRGARRANFEKLYLRDEMTLRKLPDDPARIPFGHWH
ncbi:hypothetical protein [Vibrio proteolyticus]